MNPNIGTGPMGIQSCFPYGTRSPFCLKLAYSGLVHSVFPSEDHRVGIDLLEVKMYTFNQLLFGFDADAPQHAARHFAEHGFNDAQPRAVLGGEDKLKSLRMKTEPSSRLFGNVCRVVVEQEANPGLRGIAFVKLAQQCDEIHTGVVIADDLRDSASVEVETSQQRYRSQAFIFVVSEVSGELLWLRRSVGCGCG